MKSRETRKRSNGESRETKAAQAKRYESVREFERQTSYCPLYLAWRIVDEARDYFRTSWVPSPGTRQGHLIRPLDTFSPSDAEKACLMSEELADKLARRAEAVFAHQPFWQRKYQSARGREYILMSMRHWLAGVLARERPALFRALPESFKIGHPLPMEHVIPVGRGYRRAGLDTSKRSDDGSRGRSPHHPIRRFVHGCEWLPV
jgi:hypothetical protein